MGEIDLPRSVIRRGHKGQLWGPAGGTVQDTSAQVPKARQLIAE